MGVRLMMITITFSLYNAVVHPDKEVTGLVSRCLEVITGSVTGHKDDPICCQRSFQRKEVMQLRGAHFSAGTFREKLKKYTWLLGSSSFIITGGLSGNCRGYASPGFGQAAAAATAENRKCALGLSPLFQRLNSAILLAVYAKLQRWADFLFYPEFSSFAWGSELIWLVAIVLCLKVSH